MKHKEKYVTGRSLDPLPDGADGELRALREENCAFAELVQIDLPAPARSASLAGAYARARDVEERTAMDNFFRFLRGRRWYAQAAALALLALIVSAVVLLHVGGGGKVELSPNAAWASSDEYALVCSGIEQIDDQTHAKLRQACQAWTADMQHRLGLGDASHLGNFIEADNGKIRIYLIFKGAERSDIERLQQQLEQQLPTGGSGITSEIEQTTVRFPQGLPSFETGIVQSKDGKVFCIAGDPEHNGTPGQENEWHAWLKAHGIWHHTGQSEAPAPDQTGQ
jgi:hypothetical protein